MQKYEGLIWIGDQPGRRVEVDADSADEAKAKIEAEYGSGHTISIWNETDADQTR